MFVQCIVGSEVARLANGVETRGSMLRDMGMYGLSITGVLIFFAMGQVRREGERLVLQGQGPSKNA
jgi:hypothetical protein